jgi:hypothetical protein
MGTKTQARPALQSEGANQRDGDDVNRGEQRSESAPENIDGDEQLK